MDETRFEGEHDSPAEDISVAITRDMGKCILCRRCVAACNNIQNTGVLNAQNRGFDTVIAPAMGGLLLRFCQLRILRPVHRGLPHRRAA